MTTPSINDTPVIVGCGFLGKYLAKLLCNSHKIPLCIIQSRQSFDHLSSEGFDTRLFDLDDVGKPLGFQLENREIYYLAPPSRTDLCDHRMDYFLSLCALNPPKKIVYISTSGVYGDCQGEWVDETRPMAPISQRATRRVYAENALTRFCNRQPTDYLILRVGGIYGPERLPVQRLRDITVICPDEAPYSNRIHVADLAHVCQIAMNSQYRNDVFNVADGHATTMTDFYYKLADFSGQPRPPCVPMSQASEKLSAGMLSFIRESRRLSIRKLQTQLKVSIQFPDLTSGLKNCFNK